MDAERFRGCVELMMQGYRSTALLKAAQAHAIRCWVIVAKRKVPRIIESWGRELDACLSPCHASNARGAVRGE